MSDPTLPHPDASESHEPASTSGGLSAGRDVRAGRDIAGRDITTNVGFSQDAVLKLMIAVGVIVFITAACFFTGGVAVGFGAITALNRPVDSNLQAANTMAEKLQTIGSLPPGQRFEVVFTEQEISSYFRFVVGPQIGVKEGSVRLLSADEIAVGGNLEQLGDRPFAATFEVQRNAEKALKLQSAAIQVVGTQGAFGWVVVPPPLLRPLADQINQFLGQDFQLTSIREVSDSQPEEPGLQPAWLVGGVVTR